MKGLQLFVVGLLLVIINGCSPVRLPSVANYKLTSVTAAHIPMRARTHKIIYVVMPIANPGYQGTDMLYMLAPFQLSSFTLHQWVAPPAQMLQPILTQAIRATGYFKAVIASPSSGDVNYRLETQLLELQQEFLTPHSQVRLVVQATLINNESNAVIASRRFVAVVPTTQNTPASGVLAANQGVTRIARQIAAFCVNYS